MSYFFSVAEAEEDFRPGGHGVPEVGVRVGEVVGGRIVRIPVEIRENLGDIDGVGTAVAGVEGGIVGPGVRDVQGCELVEVAAGLLLRVGGDGAVVHAVHQFDGADGDAGVDDDLCARGQADREQAGE